MIGRARGSLAIQGQAERRIAHLDEDEVTLCVAAAQALMPENVDPPVRIRRVEWAAGPAPAWLQHVLVALGLSEATVQESSGEPDAETLRLRVHYDSSGRPAEATARLGDTAEPPPRAETPRWVDDAFLQRLDAAEKASLAQVPMGAYVPRPTWDATLEQRYRLLVSTCDTCRGSYHPAFRTCPRCEGPTRIQGHRRGVIHTFTGVAKGAGPTEFDQWQALAGDYGVAVVELEAGLRVAGMLTSYEPDRLRIGQPVRAVLRRLYAQEGEWRYGIKFQPIDQAQR